MAWADRQGELARLEQAQLFFIGGAPRSGTTWLQQILDAHPDVSCRGEGLFLNHLARPLDALMGERAKALDAKNTTLFRHTGGYPLPSMEDAESLTGTAILLALRRQYTGPPPAAVGEKTPENVFFFPRLHRLFPRARFIAIARDPRDVLTSAWHFFRRPPHAEDTADGRLRFVRDAIPALQGAAHAMIDFAAAHPAQMTIVTYEQLSAETAAIAAGLFRFLGVDDSGPLVADCVARTAFATQTGGRLPGAEQRGAFHRKGVPGDWPTTLTPEMNALVVEALGGLFPKFGWQP